MVVTAIAVILFTINSLAQSHESISGDAGGTHQRGVFPRDVEDLARYPEKPVPNWLLDRMLPVKNTIKTHRSDDLSYSLVDIVKHDNAEWVFYSLNNFYSSEIYLCRVGSTLSCPPSLLVHQSNYHDPLDESVSFWIRDDTITLVYDPKYDARNREPIAERYLLDSVFSFVDRLCGMSIPRNPLDTLECRQKTIPKVTIKDETIRSLLIQEAIPFVKRKNLVGQASIGLVAREDGNDGFDIGLSVQPFEGFGKEPPVAWFEVEGMAGYVYYYLPNLLFGTIPDSAITISYKREYKETPLEKYNLCRAWNVNINAATGLPSLPRDFEELKQLRRQPMPDSLAMQIMAVKNKIMISDLDTISYFVNLQTRCHGAEWIIFTASKGGSEETYLGCLENGYANIPALLIHKINGNQEVEIDFSINPDNESITIRHDYWSSYGDVKMRFEERYLIDPNFTFVSRNPDSVNDL